MNTFVFSAPCRMKAKTLRDCLREKLGEGRWPRSFVVIGDIAIINLRDEHLRYSREIAECIMEAQKRVRAVFAKIVTEGTFRIAKLIHLGGMEKTETIFKQAGCKFKVDVTKVYVNPSLETEYLRIASLIKEGEEILDMFCGAGFFLIHAACRKRVFGIGIDINNHAIRYAKENSELNKLEGIVEFIHSDSSYTSSFLKKKFDRIIMNLPHSSEEFLPQALSLIKRCGFLHLYKLLDEEEVDAFKVKLETYRLNLTKVRKVLDYAPRKGIFVFDLSSCPTNSATSGFNV